MRKRKNVRLFNQHLTGLLFRTSLTDQDDEFVDSFGRLKERDVFIELKSFERKEAKKREILKIKKKTKI